MKKIILALVLFALPFSTHALQLTNPLQVSEPEDVIANVIQALLGITGSIALLLFIYGGIVWMTSAGNSDRVQRGKNIFVWATVGLIIIFSSYAILSQLFDIIAN